MQVFVALLSNVIDQGKLETSWHSDRSVDPLSEVVFAFNGRQISMTFELGPSGRWQSESVHRAFSKAVRRVDQDCNIRWM